MSTGVRHRIHVPLSLLLITGAAYAFSSAVDLLAGALVGVYSASAFVPGVVWSILATILLLAARRLAPGNRWLASPYVAFGALATLDGLLHSRPHAFIVAAALSAFGLLIWKASNPKATQSDRDAWLFAALGWDPTLQRRLPARTARVWITAVSLVGGAVGTLAMVGAYFMPRENRWILFTLIILAFLVFTGVQVILRREVLARLDMEDDQRAAQRIQSRLLPVVLPSVPGVELAAHYSPFRLIGGDYYDAVRLDKSRLLLAIADVSGKGTGAALLTANLQAILHFVLFGQDTLGESRAFSPDTLATAVNAHLVYHTEANRFVTMVIAVLDLTSRRLSYVNAGHNPPLALGSDGRRFRLEATGLPLGMLETATYSCAELTLSPGTTLLFYTDGLSERSNRSGEMYGETRINDALRAATGQSAESLVATVLRAVEHFADEPAEDDVALLAVRLI